MISQRLKAVADYLNVDDKVIDIACDHALLDIYLVKEKKLNNIIVSDINQNALNNAIANIKKYNLEKNITPVLSDGLENINHINHDTIVISGLGTINIIKILKEIKKFKHIKKIVIQANNDHYYLRSFITRQKFFISDESIIKDNGKEYITIVFKRGKKRYNKKELMYGPILIKNKEYKDYYINILNRAKTLLNNIPLEHKFERNIINQKIKKLTEIISEL